MARLPVFHLYFTVYTEFPLSASNHTNTSIEKLPTSECNCSLSLTTSNEGDKELILLKIVLEAVFDYNSNDNKQEVHKEVSKATFSQVMAIALAICGVNGIPPFSIPEVEFENVITKKE